MLDNPNPDDPMNPEAAEMFKKDYEQYVKLARECTHKYAIKDKN